MNNTFKTVFLDAGTVGNDIDISVLRQFGELKVYENTSSRQVRERIADADFVVLNKVRLNRGTTTGETGNVKAVFVCATGYDNIDTEFMKEKNIAVYNVKGYSTASVVQLTVSMVMSLSTNLFQFRNYVAKGKYSAGVLPNCLEPVFHEIKGKTWGIIGFGNIGADVAKAAEALGCNVVINRRKRSGDPRERDIDDLVRESDIISVHVPLDNSTRGLLDKRRIGLMKKDAILVNTARGAVCDEEALCEAVGSGNIGGIGVDVYSSEPFRDDSPYYRIKALPNVILTPHMAWGSFEARQRCICMIANNIKAFIGGSDESRIV